LHHRGAAWEGRVNNRLTLNLGVRYELFTVPVDPYGRLRILDPQALEPWRICILLSSSVRMHIQHPRQYAERQERH
jgi:hypothetical protein